MTAGRFVEAGSVRSRHSRLGLLHDSVMATLQTRIRDTVGRWLGKELTVDEVRDLGPHFRRLRVRAPWLQTARVAAGDKLQIMILDAGPRTYSPFAHDTSAGTLELLAFVHADTATGAWVRGLQAGTTFHALGPRGSLALADLAGPVVLFGDETSFAVATALQKERGSSAGLSFTFESSAPGEARAVLGELGLSGAELIERQPGRAHLPTIESSIRAALARQPDARLVLTGHAQTIQALRAGLRAQPPAYAGQKVKAYWADGKRGLD
jgi:NADPH-dependent ferric siderophore reductase